MDRLPNFDTLLELRLLELHTDSGLQTIRVPPRIKSNNPHGASVGRAQALDALHGGGFPSTVRPDQTEDLARLDLERDVIDRHECAIGFA